MARRSVLADYHIWREVGAQRSEIFAWCQLNRRLSLVEMAYLIQAIRSPLLLRLVASWQTSSAFSLLPGLSSRSPHHQYHCITPEDLAISHTDLPAMKSAENVQETEALSNAGILDSGPEIGPGVGRRESRDWGRPPSVSRLAPAPHHHSPVRPPISPPDLPIHPGIHLPTRGCLIPDQVISWIEGITEDGTDRLTGDAAQVFTDTVYEVRLHTPSLPRHTASLLHIFRMSIRP